MRLDRVTTEAVSADPVTLENAVGIVLFSASGLDRRASEAIGRAVEAGAGLLLVPGPALDPDACVAGAAGGGRRARDGRRVERRPADLRADRRAAPGVSRVRHRRGASRIWRGSGAPFGGPSRTAGAPSPASATARPRSSRSPGHAATCCCSRATSRTRGTTSPCTRPSCRSCTTCCATSRQAGRWPRNTAWASGQAPAATGPGVVELAPEGRRAPAAAWRSTSIYGRPTRRASRRPHSSRRCLARAEPARAPSEASQRNREGDQSLWRYGLMLMLAGLVVESLVVEGCEGSWSTDASAKGAARAQEGSGA